MFDQQHCDISRQSAHGGENFVAFVLGNSGCRFIEQQYTWTAGDRDRDLQQTLLAVGQDRGALINDIGEAKSLQYFDDFRH